MDTFSLLTLNCFGVPGWNTRARLRTLSRMLNEAPYELVCLQEVQTHRYRQLLTTGCQTSYAAQAYAGFVHAPKGGLLTLARTSIDQHEFRLFHERGLWYTPAVMDWILHKGVLVTDLTVAGVPITVLNTHLTANYMGNWTRNNPFAKQEYTELMQIAELVNTIPIERLVIVCGDFNIPRGSWLYDELLTAARLVDPLSGDKRPTFRPYSGMGRHYGAPIDFTLYRAPQNLQLNVEAELQFESKVSVEGRAAYLSDHLGIETRFTWSNWIVTA